MPYTKAISPVSNSYLTKGKEYPIQEISKAPDWKHGYTFTVRNDQGVYQKYLQDEPNQGLSWQLK